MAQAHKKSSEQEVSFPLTRNVWKNVDAFYRFSRAYTIIGSIVGPTSVSLLPLVSFDDLSPAFFAGLLQVMIPIILVNVYVVGINQVYDVDIDKVNKPNLPIASGEYSMETGKAIVSAFGLLSIITAFMSQSPPVIYCLLVCFFFGTAYSIDVPLLRWKKNTYLAAISIVIVRAFTIQLAVYYHIQKYVLGRPVLFPRSLAFAIFCMSLIVTVIALVKDLPDVDGDRDFGMQTPTIILGKKRVFWLSITILLIAYGSAVVIGASSSLLLSKLVTVTGHCILASILWFRALSVDLDSNKSTLSFYMFVWKLFYAEYLLIPFVR
ncbi:homogentisate phytyltransferase 1, chloroplastic-like [Apium graveolens]|uniref:homogentisate phytyltransferase 1, chloroplastic-like n=1 Tax=Apium graveolens TaxID=4045 RepID=UPI003D7BC23D